MTAGDITTVVLAAGASSRLGRPKQLVITEGRPLVARAARAALDAGLGPVLVVVGAGADAVERALDGLEVRCVRNERWERGIGSSIAAGVDVAAGDPACAAVILTACDQPGVTAAHLRALAAAWRSGHADAVGSGYGGTVGIPALFARHRFPALATLDQATGARTLLAGSPAVPCPECEADIDTPGDLPS